MTSALAFSRGYVRARTLKARFWTALDRPMLVRAGIDPDGRPVSGVPSAVYPSLVACYVALTRVYPSAVPIFTALLRLHEIENVKLLWRAAVRRRPVASECWRPLEPLATVPADPSTATPQDLIDRLARTPYGSIARALLRSHGADLPATEIGLDRWALLAIYEQAVALPKREEACRRLLLAVIRERDLDMLRRGAIFGLDADLVAKATVVLSQESSISALMDAVRWQPGCGPLWRALPPRLVRETGEASTWDDAMEALRRMRLRGCRRAFLEWPYQLAPALAALLLREEQARAAASIAAAAHAPAGLTILPQALAAGLLGA